MNRPAIWLRCARGAALLPLAASVLAQAAPPETVGGAIDPGQLLCFSNRESAAADAVTCLHLVELATDRAPRCIWRSPRAVRVLRRLDRDHLLLASFAEPYALLLLDAATGEHRVLAPGAPHGFVAVHGDEVLFVGDGRAKAKDNHLYAVSWRAAAAPRRCLEQRFAAVAAVVGNLAFGITEDRRRVVAVSLTSGRGRTLLQVPERERDLRVALAPGGQRLAIGSVAGGKGHLRVVDVGSGALQREWTDLPIDVSPFSSSTPTLEVGWADDDHVVCSQTQGGGRGSGNFVFVHRDLGTGEVTLEDLYAPVGLAHLRPPPPDAAPPDEGEPRFQILTKLPTGKSTLNRAGADEPLVAIEAAHEQYQDLAISPDGAHATARCGPKKQRLCLFAGDDDAERELSTNWSFDLVWLPASQ
ncbi:MAG: hypothetical protein H6838_20275 [Planctomycetes bacterium]|nr:hypothetical protein [Planctomycetota bacterium]